MKGSKLPAWIPLGIGVILLGFTAFRTLDLFQQMLPPDQQIWAWFALGAFDGALLGWAWYYKDGAKGQAQRSIAMAMFVLSVLAVAVAVIGDGMLTSGQRGLVQQLDPEMTKMIVIATGAIIVVNVVATLITHMVDPESMKAAAERAARQKIEEKALESLESQTDTLAAELAPVVAQTMVDNMRAKVMHGLSNYGADQVKAGAGLNSLFKVSRPAATPAPVQTMAAAVPGTSGRRLARARRLREARTALAAPATMPASVTQVKRTVTRSQGTDPNA